MNLAADKHCNWLLTTLNLVCKNHRLESAGSAVRLQVVAWLEEKGLGARQVNYKLRDWLFARQR